MRRSMFYDEHNGVWRTSDGYGFGIIDDGLYPGEYRHRLKICSETKYREFDLINFCRDFVKQFGVAPNTMKATERSLLSQDTTILCKQITLPIWYILTMFILQQMAW